MKDASVGKRRSTTAQNCSSSTGELVTVQHCSSSAGKTAEKIGGIFSADANKVNNLPSQVSFLNKRAKYMEPVWRPESRPESLDLEEFHTRLAIKKIHAALDRNETRLTMEEVAAIWPRDEWSGQLLDADDPNFSAALDKRIEQWAKHGTKHMGWNKCQQLLRQNNYSRLGFDFQSNSAVKDKFVHFGGYSGGGGGKREGTEQPQPNALKNKSVRLGGKNDACRRCGMWTHTRDSCTLPVTVKCTSCQSVGHLARACQLLLSDVHTTSDSGSCGQ